MRDRSDAEVLAPLERELRDDPVVHDLAARLARCDRAARLATPAAPRSARTVLVTGLALMLVGCVALSPTAAGAGVLVALAALALAAHRSGRGGPGTRGVP